MYRRFTIILGDTYEVKFRLNIKNTQNFIANQSKNYGKLPDFFSNK